MLKFGAREQYGFAKAAKWLESTSNQTQNGCRRQKWNSKFYSPNLPARTRASIITKTRVAS